MDWVLPVLIVGAGPSGLMMGCELARHGIPFRIIDKNDSSSTISNATWIQTLTIEIFAHIEMVQQFMDAGNSCNAINIYINGEAVEKIPFSDIDSIYKFVLMLPQKKTETILQEQLQKAEVMVERSLELIDIKQHKDRIDATVKSSKGVISVIKTHYLVACDGANSTVRQKCNMVFPGEDLSEQFVVADAFIDSYMSEHEIHAFFSKGTFFTAFPLGLNRYRISANLDLPVTRKTFYEKEVIEMAQERAHGAYYVKSVSWISTFWIHGKVINKMREGAVFFVGDAAHIHAPTAGQGMNTGIQDAHNLAWKLALVIKSKAQPAFLDSYHAERYPVVSHIVNENNHYLKMAITEKSFLKKLRHLLTSLNEDGQTLNKAITMELTQLNTAYRDSPIIRYNKTKTISYCPGQHANNIMMEHDKTLYDYLLNPLHNILLFTGIHTDNAKLTLILTLQTELESKYKEIAKTHLISPYEMNVANLILDNNGLLHDKFQVKSSLIVILRPDNFIAYRSSIIKLKPIEKFFKNTLGLLGILKTR